MTTNNNFEFINYIKYPEDPYTLGIATVRITYYDKNGHPKKIVQKFSNKKTKTGGEFISMANYQVTENGEKKYITASKLVDSDDDDALLDFIRKNIKGSGSVSLNSSLPTKNDTPFQTNPFINQNPTSMSEAHASSDQLPF